MNSEDLYDFVNNASICLHSVDKNGIILWANQIELDTLGYSMEEYIGYPITDFHADPDVIEEIIKRLKNFETLSNFKARLRCKDGTIKHVLISSNVYQENGEFIHSRCFTRDITAIVEEEERKAELLAKLEESEGLLKISRDIIAFSYDAIISKDLNGIVTSWNKSAETIFGYTAEEMIGKPISILLPIDRLSEEVEIYDRLRKGEHVQHFETKRVTKNKQHLDVSLSISPIKDKDGNIIGLSKIVRDITQEKMEEARKNAFVSVVSHELKTPLTSILAYIQILLGKSKNDSDTFNISLLTKTELQAKKMISMVHDFLNIGRMEEGKVHLNKEVFDFNLLVEEVIQEFRLTKADSIIHYKNCEGAILFADRDMIGQVLTNLISNAIKYSPKEKIIKVVCEKDGDHIVISVTDHGIGISTKDQRQLFNRFYRVENETTTTISGFGIGLYLVSEILRIHGSKIEVISEEGRGSTFHFRLPIK